MTQEVEVRTLTPQPTMSIRGWITIADISRAIGERLGAIWKYVQSQGGEISGAPYTRYHEVDGERIDFEAGLPVKAALPPSGEILATELPGGEVAVLAHFGPYEQLPITGQRLADWVAEQGRAAAGPNWESYVTDPGTEPDPQKWKTEILKPLSPRA